MQIITALIAALALVVSARAYQVAQRSLGIAQAKEDREVSDRHEAAGPVFVAEPVTIGADDTAEIRLRMEGGPGSVNVTVRSANQVWCPTLSYRSDGDPQSSLTLPLEPGEVIVLTAHLTDTLAPTVIEGMALPLLLDVRTLGVSPNRWRRRVPVLLVPRRPPAVY